MNASFINGFNAALDAAIAIINEAYDRVEWPITSALFGLDEKLEALRKAPPQ